jgi:phage gp29-like protein
VFRQAEMGDPRTMCQMFDDIVRRDATLRGYVGSRRAAIAGKPVLILPAGPDKEDRKAADMFRDIWERVDTQSILEEHAQGPNFYGWAASEIDWQWVRQDRLFNPVGFFTPRAETFRIAVEYDPYVRDARQDELLVRVGYYPHEVARMIPGKWVVTPRTGVERRVWDGLMVTSAIYSILNHPEERRAWRSRSSTLRRCCGTRPAIRRRDSPTSATWRTRSSGQAAF